MRREKLQKHEIETPAILLLFAVFAALILTVLLTGADGYRRLTERDDASFDRRTAVQYVATKVRQSDAAGRIFTAEFGFAPPADGVGAFQDGETLFLGETADGVWYYTRIYYYDGYIRELFTEDTAQVSPEDGEPVLEARGLEFTLQGGVLTVTATDKRGAVTVLTLLERADRVWAAPGEGAAS